MFAKSRIFEQLSGQIAETLRRAFEEANVSIDELAALSGIAREEIVGALFRGEPVSARTSAVLAAILGGRLGEQKASSYPTLRKAQ